MIRRPTQRRRGSAATEFALWLPFLAILTSGVVDFSWYMSRSYNVARIVRDSARTGAAVREDNTVEFGTQASAAAREHADRVLDGLGMTCHDGCTVDVQVEDDGFRMITVSVSYPYQPLIGLVSVPTTIHYDFTMALEAQ